MMETSAKREKENEISAHQNVNSTDLSYSEEISSPNADTIAIKSFTSPNIEISPLEIVEEKHYALYTSFNQQLVGFCQRVKTSPELANEVWIIELDAPNPSFINDLFSKTSAELWNLYGVPRREGSLDSLKSLISSVLGKTVDKLSIDVLWEFCWQLHLPYLPWEIKNSFYTALKLEPSQYTIKEDKIFLNTNLSNVILPLEKMACKSVLDTTSNTNIATIVGHQIIKTPVDITFLVSKKSTNELLKLVGKVKAEQITKFKRRIQTLFQIPEEHVLCPGSIAKYYLHFYFTESFRDVNDVERRIIEIFDFEKLPLSQIKKISEQNIIV